MLLQALVSRPTIADHLGSAPDAAPDEPGQRLGGTVFDPRQPDPTGAAIFGQFDRSRDQEFADVTATPTAVRRIVLGAEGDAGLVHLDDHAGHRLAIGIDHGAAELVVSAIR